jgi:hypothetical protein
MSLHSSAITFLRKSAILNLGGNTESPAIYVQHFGVEIRIPAITGLRENTRYNARMISNGLSLNRRFWIAGPSAGIPQGMGYGSSHLQRRSNPDNEIRPAEFALHAVHENCGST